MILQLAKYYGPGTPEMALLEYYDLATYQSL